MTVPLLPSDYPPNGIAPDQRLPGTAFQTQPDPGLNAGAAANALIKETGATPPEVLGPWLEEDTKAVFDMIHADVEAQEAYQRNLHAWRLKNRGQRDGRRFGRLSMEKVSNSAVWKYTDYAQDHGGTDYVQAVPNKVGDLLRKIEAQCMADPPQPEAQPSTADREDIESAEFATRLLVADGDPARSNDAAKLSEALAASLVDQAGYLYLYTDENGGGWRPKQIMAAPMATDPNQPQMVPGPAPLDPVSGALLSPQTGPDGQPMPPPLVPYDGDLTMRYVNEDVSQFVDSPSLAGRQWQAAFVIATVDASSVRLLPPTAPSVTDAEGAIILRLVPFASLERWFPDVAKLSDEIAHEIVAWEPPRANEIIPPDWLPLRQKAAHASKEKGKEGRPRADALCWYYAAYRKATPEYPKGAFVYCGGNGQVFARGPMAGDVELPDGTTRTDLLDVPLADCVPTLQGAVIDWFSSPEEFRARIFMGVLESLDQNLHPHVYVMATSPLQDFDYGNRDGSLHEIGQKDDVPQLEEPREIPSMAMDAVEFMGAEMDNAAGRPETAQGAIDATVNSGTQFMAAVEQSKVTLGPIIRASLSCAQRLWRVKLQQARTKFTIPQRIRYVGEDGSATEAWFRGADLHGVEDVSVARGSGTALSPSQKQGYTQGLVNMGVLTDPLEIQRMLTSGVSGTIGLQDNPNRQRIARQIKAWSDGPPKGWTPPVAPMPAGPPPVDATGRPVPPPPPPPLPCFLPLPVDTEPQNAAWRARELGNVMASTLFSEQPPEWQQGLIAEYTRMVQAQTPPPAAPPVQNAPPSQPPPAPGANAPAPMAA